jgi:hypothetical protein
MKIDVATPTTPRAPRHDWSPLMNLLRTNPVGVSFRVALTDLPGTSKTDKQVRVHNVAARHSMAVRTQTEGEYLFVERIEETK